MTQLWADDFSTYGIGGQAFLLNGDYAELTGSGGGGANPTLAADPDPTSPGDAVLRISANTQGTPTFYGSMQTLRKALPSEKATIGGSVRIWMDNLPSSNNATPIIRFADASNVANIFLGISTIGQVLVYRGDMFSTAPSGRTLLGATSGIVSANAWNHIEWKVLFSDTVGTVEVRVNGVVAVTLTAQDTLLSGAGCANVSLGMGNIANVAPPVTYFRDLIIWDTAGTLNNNFYGTCFVGRYTVNSDVAFNWTPSTGTTGFNLVNEKGPNDANYVSAGIGPIPAASRFGLEDLPVNATSIRSIQLKGRMQKSDGGDCQVQMALYDGTSDSPGADRPITTAFTYWNDTLELNVTTGLPWTRTEFNAADFKINRTV